MARGYTGPEDPDKGTPHRHTRAKIALLMQPIMEDHLALAAVIGKIAQKRPEDVLDAVIEVVSDARAGECGLPGPCTEHGNCACDDIKPEEG